MMNELLFYNLTITAFHRAFGFSLLVALLGIWLIWNLRTPGGMFDYTSNTPSQKPQLPTPETRGDWL